ncbi:hypothetical protein ACFV5G_06045 [Streptomyces sp. NPDC059766]|uniref:hypothetical protein n=1 Tax=Streptomyces sp. NPDC059766 TaxID=3346940 RepID=UPI003656C492
MSTIRKWGPVAAVVVPLAFMGWGLWSFVTALRSDPMAQEQSVPCADAMRFVDRDGLPEGAHDAKCTALSWLDTTYTVRFTIGRPKLDAWLKESYPGTRLTAQECGGEPETDVCAHIELNPPAEGGAVAIDIGVRYTDASTAVVEFSPFDV